MMNGKRFLVTGASANSDIGTAICHELANLGSSLIMVARDLDKIETLRRNLKNPERHESHSFDLYNLDAISSWLNSVAEGTGQLNGMVHSASFQGYSPLRGVSKTSFDQYFQLNTGAALMLSKAFSNRKVCADKGSIVLIGSAAGDRGQKARSLYAASKAALNSIAKSLAIELSSKGIRVNVVAPAVVKGSKAEEQFKLLTSAQNSDLLSRHPLGFGRPADIAMMCRFLLSDDASWITGQIMGVDGGFTA